MRLEMGQMMRSTEGSRDPTTTVLSIIEAADMLGISRPALSRLLEEGEIPLIEPRRHRRILLTEVHKYLERQAQEADAALSDIVADATAFGDYDQDLAPVRTALRAARGRK